jgi:BirA family biotin operon repressor/biotin-[acetyl-CoA-carboxylase] ligase
VNGELIQRHATLPSTQDLLHRIAEDGAPDGTVVVAAEQEGGRGQRGRTWHSPLGGLWMSVLVRPKAAAAGEVLSLRAGLAVARVLARYPTLPALSLKWPNDLFIADKKVGGLLCEARWRGSELWWVAVGLGINVANAVPTEVAELATSLGEYDRTLTAEALIAPLAAELALLGAAGATLSPDERAEFATRHWLKGKRISAPVQGTVGPIAADGALMVGLQEGGQMAVRAASVVLA